MKNLILFTAIFSLSTSAFAAENLPASMRTSEPAPQAESSTVISGVQIGSPAPDFKVVDINNVNVDSTELKGKITVLEWYNKDCPFVRKHYDSNNMQNLQKQAKDQDIAWITILSSAKGKQGYLTVDEAKENYKKENMQSAYFIRDEDGELGRLYNAKTTPHMYIIDKAGNLAYMGAIDNKPTADQKDLKGALNYVRSAMNALYHGGALGTQVSQPYGCSVKYAD
jgi:peroxiredoxin